MLQGMKSLHPTTGDSTVATVDYTNNTSIPLLINMNLTKVHSRLELLSKTAAWKEESDNIHKQMSGNHKDEADVGLVIEDDYYDHEDKQEEDDDDDEDELRGDRDYKSTGTNQHVQVNSMKQASFFPRIISPVLQGPINHIRNGGTMYGTNHGNGGARIVTDHPAAQPHSIHNSFTSVSFDSASSTDVTSSATQKATGLSKKRESTHADLEGPKMVTKRNSIGSTTSGSSSFVSVGTITNKDPSGLTLKSLRNTFHQQQQQIVSSWNQTANGSGFDTVPHGRNFEIPHQNLVPILMTEAKAEASTTSSEHDQLATYTPSFESRASNTILTTMMAPSVAVSVSTTSSTQHCVTGTTTDQDAMVAAAAAGRENIFLREQLEECKRTISMLNMQVEKLETENNQLRQLPTGKISQIPVEDMLKLMYEYGSEVSDMAMPPRKSCVQKASVVRQFRRWNPNFLEYFEHRNGRWVPKLGKVAELRRRDQCRRDSNANKQQHKKK